MFERKKDNVIGVERVPLGRVWCRCAVVIGGWRVMLVVSAIKRKREDKRKNRKRIEKDRSKPKEQKTQSKA